MVKTRTVAYRLATTRMTKTKSGTEISSPDTQLPLLEVTQKKVPLSNPTEETVRGPIRLRLLRLPPVKPNKDK